ncbi:MAG: HAD-IB family hydrolase [Treponema sp.]|jgi:HAD superfamily hydrolase (TIGR01490 family)|nr:HAD-IB family hydrolase [Treponema sp.]
MNNQERKVHLFDVDHTLVRKNTATFFIFIAMKHKIIRFSQVKSLILDLIKYKIGRPDIDFIEKSINKLAGIKKSDLENIAQICFQTKIKQNIYSNAALLIKEAQKKGEKVIFATSSLDFIIKPIEDFFGIEGSLVTSLEYNGGKTTGKLNGYGLFGKKKKTAAIAWMEKNGIRPQDVSFYSDSYTDIPLLEYCGNPVVVNPDMKLKRKAKKNGWKILRFKELLPAK